MPYTIDPELLPMLEMFPDTPLFHGSSLLATARVSQRDAAEMFAVLSRGLRLDG